MWNNPGTETIRDILTRYRHIAVIGLSPKPERDSHRVTRYMQRAGYTVTGVNPGQTTILGRPCYPSLLAVPPEVPVEIVNIFRRSERVAPHVDEAIARGARCVWMQMGIADEVAAARATAAGLTVVMNRCIMVDHRMQGL
jgi:predicted CoA-binding protein